MSKLHGLDAYGYVVNAWLDGELETSGLSEIPALGWFWSDLLKHRMWMIDELENWAGIIRENDQPFRDGEGFREEGPGDHVDQHQEDDDARPVPASATVAEPTTAMHRFWDRWCMDGLQRGNWESLM